MEIRTALTHEARGFDQHRYGFDFAEQTAVDSNLAGVVTRERPLRSRGFVVLDFAQLLAADSTVSVAFCTLVILSAGMPCCRR